MSQLLLFYRLLVRPLFREPVRAALTLLAIGLGVAVVLAMDLAGDAAAGSFHSSLETLNGDSDLEVTASGGVPEKLVGTLATLPYALRVEPRVEDYAAVPETQQTVPLIGLDFVAKASQPSGAAFPTAQSEDALKHLDADRIWVGESFGWKAGEGIPLLINDQIRTYTVHGVFPDPRGSAPAIVMDIAAAQKALNRPGRVDRVLIKTAPSASLEEWQRRLTQALPVGVLVRPAGAGRTGNRRMLAAFRWNLQLLSYIALVVGAFLIYNTI